MSLRKDACQWTRGRVHRQKKIILTGTVTTLELQGAVTDSGRLWPSEGQFQFYTLLKVTPQIWCDLYLLSSSGRRLLGTRICPGHRTSLGWCSRNSNPGMPFSGPAVTTTITTGGTTQLPLNWTIRKQKMSPLICLPARINQGFTR